MAAPKQKALRDLQALGLKKNLANQAYYVFGPLAAEQIAHNPYVLLQMEGSGLWQEADQLAARLGFDEFSDERISGAILCALQGSLNDGHVYLPQYELNQRALRVLNLDEPSVLDNGLHRLQKQHQIVIAEERGDPLIYLEKMYRAECSITAMLSHLYRSSSRMALQSPSAEDLEQVERELNIRLAPAQRDAVNASLENKIVIITGGPGTGKTTIIRGVLHLWEQKGAHMRLAAPTGRAAKRMRESTGRKAMTIHRLLEYNPDTGGFNRNRSKKLKADLLVIDESSMIDTELMASLLEALPDHCHLLMVGDVDQLPAVGPGFVLHDLIECGCLKTIRLHEIYRQERGSLISVNAQRINEGKMPETQGDGIENGQDFFFITRNDTESAKEAVLEMVADRIPRQFGLNPKTDIQVLCTMNKREAGVDVMNPLLQERVTPADYRAQSPFYPFAVGEKIMQIKNDYNKDVFNGDIGFVQYINEKEKTALIEFDGENKSYTWDDLTLTTLAYAVTVHKSQGSEYPAVVLPLLTLHHPMLQRNLLYTAVSRGKQLVVIVGQKVALEMAVKNNKIRRRYTNLCELLKRAFSKKMEKRK